MTRKPSDISPLVAAQIRPKRTPPVRIPPQSRTGELRISHGDPIQTESSDTAACADCANRTVQPEQGDQEESLRQAARELRIADTAIGEIFSHLLKLKELLQPSRGARRKSPREIARIQEQTDMRLFAIDEIVSNTTADGRPLLTGNWSLTVTNGAKTESLFLASMETRCLGTPQAGFVTSLRSGEAHAPSRSHNALTRVILEAAISQVSKSGERLLAFATQTIEPLLRIMDVARENAAAAQAATLDTDFTQHTSQMTRSDILATKSNQFSRRPTKRISPSTLWIED